MKHKMFKTILITAILVTILVFAFGLVNKPDQAGQENNIFSLEPPAFVSVARAETKEISSFLDDEAGISGYFQATGPIEITDDVRSAFRTIEVETTDYIIGSVAVTDYPESEDVHVYVHVDGWILAYYLADDPAAKIFDWYDYANNGGTEINTKFEKVVAIVASLAGVPFPGLTYYDFRFPNATQLMLIAENEANGNDFTVNLPSSFTVYERSWGLRNTDGYNGSNWVLDGIVVGSVCNGCVGQGLLTAAQLLPDATHTIGIDDYGGLALIYREP